MKKFLGIHMVIAFDMLTWPCASKYIHNVRKIALWTTCRILRIKVRHWGKEGLLEASKDKCRRERNRILRGRIRRSCKFLI